MSSSTLSNTKTFKLADEQATVAFGVTMADVVRNTLEKGIIVYLNGDLGAGKTTLTRGFVQGMGHKGNVKSPTYTLVEPYELPPWHVYHFDLYRLADPEELEFMGIRDYFAPHCSCFIEWPENGAGLLAEPDVIINLAYQDEHRILAIEACTDIGRNLMHALI